MNFVKKLRKHSSGVGDSESSTVMLSDDFLLDPNIPPEAKASELVSVHGKKETRKISFPRASSLYNACMRQHVLCTVTAAEVTSELFLASKIVYGFGNAIHFWLQNSPDMLGDNRIGWWRCASCGKVLYFGKPPKSGCSYCGGSRNAILYKEHFMRINGRFKVTGHPDMFFQTQGQRVRVMEFKTMEGGAFEGLKAPLVEHVWQVGTYVRFLKEDSRMPVKVDDRYGAILYITKRFKSGQFPAKLFAVELTDALSARIEGKLGEFAKGLERAPDWLPDPHAECRTHGFRNYRAKSCPCRQECLAYEERVV